jgi:hypothetical protein
MQFIKLTVAAMLLAGLSGCIVVPAGGGYYSGGHGYYHDYDGRRGYR